MSLNGLRSSLRALLALALVGALGALLAACGGSDDTTASTGGGATTGEVSNSDSSGSASSGKDAVAAAEAAVEEGYAGTDRPLPKSGPKASGEKKDVWIVVSTMEGEGAARPAEAAAEAAKELGWDATIADGKLDPNEESNQIRNAISAGADAIITVSLACEALPGAFEQAKDAGVKVYGVFSDDCEQPLLDGKVEFGPDIENLPIEAVEPAIAQWVTAQTKGEGNIVQLVFDDGGELKEAAESFATAIGNVCPKCQLKEVPLSGADIGNNKVQAVTSAALAQNPDADVVWAPVDGIILLGVGAAVGEANAQGREVLLTGLEGLKPDLEMIAEGGPQSLAAGSPGAWYGWAAIDGLNRMFAGAPAVDAGIGYQLIDAEHPPATVPYEGNKRSLGWKDNYRRIWGVGQEG